MVWAAYSPRLLLQLALRPANIWRLDFPGEGPKKKRAITAYSSQFEPCPPWTSPVLAADFASAFSFETEYFFETAQ
jgi:hypothetical protein